MRIDAAPRPGAMKVKPHRIVSFLLVLGLLLARPVAAQQWKTYSFPADGFSASFPAEPDQTAKDLDTANGKVEVRSYATQDGQTALLVGVFGYKKGLARRDPWAVLEAAKQGVLTSSNAHLVGEAKIALGSNPGLEFTAENDATRITVRIYLKGDSVYQLVVYSPGKAVYAGAKQFFDSFQLSAAIK